MQKHHSQPRSDLRLFMPLANCNQPPANCFCVSKQIFLSLHRFLPCSHVALHYCGAILIHVLTLTAHFLSGVVQLKELLEGPYRTLEAFRSEGKSTVSLFSCVHLASQLSPLSGALPALACSRVHPQNHYLPPKLDMHTDRS